MIKAVNNNTVTISPTMQNDTIKQNEFEVVFKYYKKPENSQPITTKSMQSLYQGLEDRAKATYLRIQQAQEYAQNYKNAIKDKNINADKLREIYNAYIYKTGVRNFF